MDSAAREARHMARERDTDESKCLMVLLPPETKMQIVSHISTQESISYLGQSCRAWHEVANEELYKRDSREKNSFAIKWMAAHAVDEQRTDSAIRTIEISRRWGGQIDAIKRPLSRSDRARSDSKDKMMYDDSTALHFAIILGNMHLTETLLEMGASLKTHCSPLLWESLDSKELMARLNYFHSIFEEYEFFLSGVFPILLAFLQSDSDMCQLLVDHGAGREAMTVYSHGHSKVMSILHFAAADCTTDHRQWQCLFDGFREYIDEPCPRSSKCTPLHVALENGCTQGMQIAVECGADKESINGYQYTPLAMAILRFPVHIIQDPKRFEEHVMCFRKFVDLGGSVNPEGDSLLALAVQLFASGPSEYSHMKQLIYFLLEHHADVDGTILEPHTNVVNELIDGILYDPDDTGAQETFKEVLSELVDKGLNLKKPARGLPSPLCCALDSDTAEPKWLLDFLCKNGATIHEEEADSAFLRWCQLPRLWATNKYNAWWQHQGQEDEIFLKWCEHPYNAWWWQHVKQISPSAVTPAYRLASKKSRQLHDILTHLPLSAPVDSS
ncbi:uncharacterized protein CPUR_05651 [Claviceps purpurea 20.1]|uniref:F-box domain-containing protein n=1 Tax=Claviceps purpurea (strain 20.1) TaxID=1111077 RepID=M1W2E0_CLAP2|nr:uncharacterized protein CPUR_05651 [Claviceps purpurea 20.1]